MHFALAFVFLAAGAVKEEPFCFASKLKIDIESEIEILEECTVFEAAYLVGVAKQRPALFAIHSDVQLGKTVPRLQSSFNSFGGLRSVSIPQI